MKRIFCGDGGGIRGLIVGAFLRRLEDAVGRTALHFDMLGGTSTSGIIMGYLSIRSSRHPDSPAHSAEQVVELYLKHAETIFPSRVAQGVRRIWSPKHRADGLQTVLRSRVREARLADALCELVIPSFDRITAEEVIFKRSSARSGDDWWLTDVCMATSAAPTYFPAHDAESIGRGVKGSFLDGGIHSNNPALCAYAEAKRLWPGERISILSVGTGRQKVSQLGPSAGGLAQWAAPLADLFMTSGERVIDYQIRTLTKALGDTYHRVQTDVPEHAGMDVVDGALFDSYVAEGHRMAEDYLVNGVVV